MDHDDPDENLAESYISQLQSKAREKFSKPKVRGEYNNYCEEDVKKAIYLRYGSMDTSRKPVRSLDEVADVLKVPKGTMTRLVGRYLEREGRLGFNLKS